LSSAKGSFPKLLTKQLTKENENEIFSNGFRPCRKASVVDASSREEALENANYGVGDYLKTLNMKR
jgi:hypothetical protein